MIIHKILSLESEAQEAMRTLEKELSHIAQGTAADMAQNMADMESEKDAAMAQLSEDTHRETQATITKIQAEYEDKRSELIAHFAANHPTWVEKISTDILYPAT